jgi:hypothetical protein
MGKQWQTTPKNLHRMQYTRAIPVCFLPKLALGLNTTTTTTTITTTTTTTTNNNNNNRRSKVD